MTFFRLQNLWRLALSLCLSAWNLPLTLNSQTDLSKFNEYVKARDCDKGISFIEKNADKILIDDPVYPEFNKSAAYLYRACRKYAEETGPRKKLYQFLRSTNPVEAANEAFQLGNLYYLLQEPDSSIHYSRIASEIFKVELGETDINYTKALNTLGTAYKSNGDYTRARQTFKEARKIKERVEVYDRQYARILNNLGDLYTRTYNYEGAEECLEASIVLKKEIGGEDSDYAKTLFSQVILWQTLGDRENLLRALEGIQKASDIFKQGNDTKNLVKCRILEGQILLSLDSAQQTILILDDVVKTSKEPAGQSLISEEDLSLVYHTLGRAWNRSDDPAKAVGFSEKALEQMALAKGTDHPKFALQLRDHANLLFEVNRSDTLDNFYIRSSEIIAKTYPRNNYEYHRSQLAYFIFLVRSGQQRKALDLYEKLGEALEEHIVAVSQFMSIAELAEVTIAYQEYFHALMMLNLMQPENAELSIRSANASLFYKGYILENIIKDRQAIKRSAELTELAEQINEKKLRLDELYKADEVDDTLIEEVKKEFQELNRSFSRVKGSQVKAYQPVEAEDVLYSLLSNEAAMEFVRIRLDHKDDPRYVVLLFHPNEEVPQVIELFLESKITNLLKSGEVSSTALYNKLYKGESVRGMAPVSEGDDVSLYNLIWEKLLPFLDDIERIYYSADGVIHAIALHAVELAPQEYTGQKFALVQTTSLRNMAGEGLPKRYTENTAFLIGGIDFGVQDVAMVRGKGEYWQDLRYTQIEVTNIETAMRGKDYNVVSMQGPEPSHERVLAALEKAPSPRIIHLATHGYFKSDNFLRVGEELDASASELDFSRSGLVLAGANDLPDGKYILTSNEIAELDLEQTELVVLSACETGLGQIYAQEGVSGLQRAFRIAGTKYMIMSLWPVPDEGTQIFMEIFYKNLIEEAKTVEESYYATQRELMSNRFAKPKDWAGFVLIR